MKKKKQVVTILCTCLSLFLLAGQWNVTGAFAKTKKTTPKLSVSSSSVLRLKEEKNYTIKLTGAGKSKVTWKINKDKYCKQTALKIVKKDKTKLIIKPVANGYGTILCTVGKKKLTCSYSVYLVRKTQKQYANKDVDELFDATLDGTVPVMVSTYVPAAGGKITKTGSTWKFLTEYKPEGEWVENFYNDMDNDDVMEVALKGTGNLAGYGGMYLDATDGIVSILAYGNETMGRLANVEYDDQSWIVYQDIRHTGYQSFTLYRFNGYNNGKPAQTITIRAEYYDNDQGGYTEDSHFFYNGTSITYDEFEEHLASFGLYGHKAGEPLTDEEDDGWQDDDDVGEEEPEDEE